MLSRDAVAQVSIDPVTGVDEATAGWLISGYALSVAVGAIGLTAAVTRFNRKHVLTALMLLFIAGNLVSALASTYEVMLLGRILAALKHGAFFGIGSVVAANLVAPEKRAGAIARRMAVHFCPALTVISDASCLT